MRIFDFLKRKNKDNISESEAECAKTLFSYLNPKLENVVPYEDLFNLCYTLFCTLDILPDDLKSLKLSKEILAKTFAKLVRERKIVNLNTNKSNEFMFNEISDERHWIEQIKVYMIADKWPNKESAKMLLEKS